MTKKKQIPSRQIKSLQKKKLAVKQGFANKDNSEDFISEKNPSEVIDNFWLSAIRQRGKYPESIPANSGKWLIFVSVNEVDTVWRKIKAATEQGLLGESSKVATARPNLNAINNNKKVICVYTYDYTDKDDVKRIRKELRGIGIENKIPYKTNKATGQGQYQIKGNTRISVYYE